MRIIRFAGVMILAAAIFAGFFRFFFASMVEGNESAAVGAIVWCLASNTRVY